MADDMILKPTDLDQWDSLYENDPDTAQALRYLILVEKVGGVNEGIKKRISGEIVEKVAQTMNITPGTLRFYRQRWTENGSLKKARGLLLAIKKEQIQRAEDEVFHYWPEIIQRMMKIALHGDERNVPVAVEWLRQHIIEPNSQVLNEGDKEALSFLERAMSGGVKVTRSITLTEKRE